MLGEELFSGVKVKAFCRTFKFFQPKFGKHVFINLPLCPGVMLEPKPS